MVSKTILKYGDNDRQVIGVWKRNYGDDLSGRWLIYIHGGAWRDPNNTYNDGEFLINELLSDHDIDMKIDGAASIDYRLSPAVKDPSHINDVMDGLRCLIQKFNIAELILVGHSAGAFLSFQAITRWNSIDSASLPLVIGVEGIYNIPYMIEEHSSYQSFVREAFGDNENEWEAASPIGNSFDWRTDSNNDNSKSVLFNGKIVIVHSSEDELLGIDYQPRFTKNYLNKAGINVVQEEVKGKHDDVYVSNELVKIVTKYLKDL